MYGKHKQVMFGINWFQTYYTAFDMDNKRVGFAESIYSELTDEQSSKFNRNVFLNLSATETISYYGEMHYYTMLGVATSVFFAFCTLAYCWLNKTKYEAKAEKLDSYKELAKKVLPERKQKDKKKQEDLEMKKILDEFDDLNMEVKLIEDDPLDRTADAAASSNVGCY